MKKIRIRFFKSNLVKPKRFLIPGLLVLFALAIGACQGSGSINSTPTRSGEGNSSLVESQVSTSIPSISPSPTLTFAAQATETPTETPEPTFTPTPEPVVLAGAGDISECGIKSDDETAAVLAQIQPDAVFTAGDNTYGGGTYKDYFECFETSWGQFRSIIHPSPGNHDYETEKNGASYFDYFGASAGEIGKGYYSYDLGGWHIVSLNSNCLNVIGGCGADSPQVQWLKADLEAHPSQCTIAYWHHPRWTSGLAKNTYWIDAFWQVLYDHNAEIVLSGHDHDYERFAPQDPQGNADPERGIREFVVGTGGAYQRAFGEIQPNSEVRNTDEFGVLKLTLYPDHYDWEFVPVAGGTFTDSGTGTCH